MDNLINKQIHAKEFRLRVLLTNDCNKNCLNCLNDFQDVRSDFINVDLVKEVLDDYNTFCYFSGINNPVVSFSGGEPGLHKSFPEIIKYAKQFSEYKIQVNTNGLVDQYDWDSDNIDIRYHIGRGLNNKIIAGQKAVYIIRETDTVKSLLSFLTPFYKGGMILKSFVDFDASKEFITYQYPYILSQLQRSIRISGRFTGIQENRGEGCNDCLKKCITLKALWVFPNGYCSPCPQSKGIKYSKEEMFEAYKFHLK